ncbi:MAG: hypothetical protein QG591_2671 [Planctomycetota bacterium]|nr:hypothetical protein [Planctomycetota bacterium]
MSEIRETANRTLLEALVKAQGEFMNVKQSGKNPFFNNHAYSTLDDLCDATKAALAKNGLAVIATLEPENGNLTLVSTLYHISGQSLASKFPLNPRISEKQNPIQAMGSEITYARRYSYAALLGLTSDEDDDGNALSEKAKPKKPKDAKEEQPAETSPPVKPAEMTLDRLTLEISQIDNIPHLENHYRKYEGWIKLQSKDVEAKILSLYKARKNQLSSEFKAGKKEKTNRELISAFHEATGGKVNGVSHDVIVYWLQCTYLIEDVYNSTSKEMRTELGYYLDDPDAAKLAKVEIGKLLDWTEKVGGRETVLELVKALDGTQPDIERSFLNRMSEETIAVIWEIPVEKFPSWNLELDKACQTTFEGDPDEPQF